MARISARTLFLLPVAGFVVLGIIFTIALMANLSGSGKIDPLPSVLAGKPAPELPSRRLEDKGEDTGADNVLSLSAYAGQPVLINFMASWCAPCRAEIPALETLSDDLVIIAIAYKDKEADLRQFLDEYGNPYASVWMDTDGAIGRKWGIYGVPESFLIDGDGIVRMRHAGPVFADVISDILIPALEQM